MASPASVAPPEGFVLEDAPSEDISDDLPDGFMLEESEENKYGDYAFDPVFERSLAQSAISGVGDILKGAARLQKPSPLYEFADTGILPEEASPLAPLEERGAFKLGSSLADYAKEKFAITPEEQASLRGQLGGMAGTVGPLMLLGPGMIPAFGILTAETEAKRAEQSGATPEQIEAAQYAGGGVGLATGLIGFGPLLRNVERTTPGLLPWATAKVKQAAISGLAFPTMVEAQEWLLSQFRKDYAPESEYEFDPNRALAAAITGGIMGPMVPAKKAWRDVEGEILPPEVTPRIPLLESPEGRTIEPEPPSGPQGLLPSPQRGITGSPLALLERPPATGEFMAEQGGLREMTPNEARNYQPSDVIQVTPEGEARPQTLAEMTRAAEQRTNLQNLGLTPDIQRLQSKSQEPPPGFVVEQKPDEAKAVAEEPPSGFVIETPEEKMAGLDRRINQGEERAPLEQQMNTLAEEAKPQPKPALPLYGAVDTKVQNMTPEMLTQRLTSLDKKVSAGIKPTTREMYEREAIQTRIQQKPTTEEGPQVNLPAPETMSPEMLYRTQKKVERAFLEDNKAAPDDRMSDEQFGALEQYAQKLQEHIDTRGKSAIAEKLKPKAYGQQLDMALSAKTDTIPGIKELADQASSGDAGAHKALNDIAADNLKRLMPKTAKVNIDSNTGLYGGTVEPSLGVSVHFDGTDRPKILSSVAKFAENFNQEQVHVRGPATEEHKEGVYDDGSYNTPSFRYDLKEPLSRSEIEKIIADSGLYGLTFNNKYIEAYHVGDPHDTGQFEKGIESVLSSLEGRGGTYQVTPKRLWVYGEGGIPYKTIRGDVQTETPGASKSAKIVSERHTGSRVKPAEAAKEITPAQEATQQKIADAYDSLPDNDMDNPNTRRAYDELAREVTEQFGKLPIKVDVWEGKGEPYKSSEDMRRDVQDNNHLYIYATTPETFGPEGSDFTGNPLLEKTEFTSGNGKPLVVNDLLRAVHDYYAHNLSPVKFGPLGEEAAWKNHMATIKSPWARWALTSETRGQNSWVNFNENVRGKDLSLPERPFARQKAALLPIEYAMTGDRKVDAPVEKLMSELSPKEQQGSVEPKISFRRSEKPEKIGKEVQVAPGVMGEPAEGFTKNQKKLKEIVEREINKLLPKEKNVVRVSKRLRATEETGQGGEVYGFQAPIKMNDGEVANLIHWALSAEEGPGARHIGRHEVIEALHRGGYFTPDEWETLTNAARAGEWIDKHDIRGKYKGLSQDEMLKESIAEEFGSKGKHTGPIGRIFDRLKLLLKRIAYNVRQSLGAKTSAEDIFTKVDTGEVGARGKSKDVGDEPAFSEKDTKPGDIFYSALQRAVENVPQKKGAPEQWKGIVKNSKGVKAEEIEWSGVTDWLESQPGTVTKAELLDYIRKEGAVQMQEVIKDGATEEDWDKYAMEWFGQPYADLDIEETAELRRVTRDRINTRYSEYVTPGGENYREMLLTLPQERGKSEADLLADQAAATKAYKDLEARAEAGEKISATEAREAQARKMVADVAVQMFMGERTSTAPVYRSHHWEEPNVLAHIRFNERRDIDGKRVLFIEEIQSDWHQTGRRKGYKVDEQQLRDTEEAALKEALAAVKRNDNLGFDRAGDAINAVYSNKDTWQERWTGVSDADAAAINKWVETSAAARANNFAAPDAPFKKTWHELALKRMLRYAAEHGFDRVAWLPGEQQAERYDLSKQVKELLYKKNENGTYQVSAQTLERGGVMMGKEITESELPNHVGKEVAQKIASGEGKEKNLGANNQPLNVWNSLSGLDLKVGGEGMKGFYDKILPSAMNKYLKKWDTKVQEGKIRTTKPNEELPYRGPGNPKWADADGAFEKAHSISITPAMRDSVMQGQPLFNRPEFARKAEEDPDAQDEAVSGLLGYTKKKAKEWADARRELLKQMDGDEPKGPIKERAKDALHKAQDLHNVLLASNDGYIRAIGNRRKSDTIKKIADMLFPDTGKGRGVAETFEEETTRYAGSMSNRLARAVKPLGKDESKLKGIARLVQNPEQLRPGIPTHEAATEITKLLNENYEYLKDAGIDLNDKIDGYFPRIPDRLKVENDPEGFKTTAVAMYRKDFPELTSKKARELADKWYDNIVYRGLGLDVDENFGRDFGVMPVPSSFKARKFSKAADEVMRPYLIQNPVDALEMFFHSSARRAAWNKRFGEGQWNKMKREMLKEGVTPSEVIGIEKAIQSATGTTPTRLSPGAREVAAKARMWQTFMFLAKMVPASLGEPSLAAVQAGNPMMAYRSYVDTFKGLFRNSKSLKERRELMEDVLGLVGQLSEDMAMNQRSGGIDTDTRKTFVRSSRYYRLVGATQYLEGSRIGAASVGQFYLKRLAKDIAKENSKEKSSAFLMRDLGVPKGEEADFAKWISSKDKIGKEDVEGDKKYGNMYAAALRRFIDQSVMHTKKSERPRYATHPIGGFVYALMGYLNSFSKNVMIRNARLARESLKGGYTIPDRMSLVTPALLTMALFLPIQAAVSELRDLIFNKPGAQKKSPTDKAMLAMSRAGFFGNYDSIVNMVQALRYERDPATSMMGATAGSMSEGIANAIKFFKDNSKNTNTAERRLAKSFYYMVLNPMIAGYATARLPAPLAAAAIQAGSHPAVAEGFVRGLAGKQKPKTGESRW